MNSGVGGDPRTRLADRYRLDRRIATGGMGAVHEGVDERLGRRVAVKILKDEHADDPLFVERFGREARAVASLNHPNIAQVFDFGEHDGKHFIVMELLEGEHLGTRLEERGRLTPEEAADLAAQVCAALSAAHAAGIVHRDIKPGNVMVQPDGRVKVTDFGIAQVTGESSLTGAGLVLGTAKYLSPEQASGQGVTPASDIYSVGVLLFEMLTGSVPFTDDSPVAVALSHVRDDVPPVRELAPDVPAGLAQVVAKATAKDPHERYADAASMEAALRGAGEPAAAGTPTALLAAVPAASGSADGRDGRRSRTGLLAVAGLLLAAALAAGWWALSDGTSSEEKDPTPREAQTKERQVTVSRKPSPSPTPASPSPSASPTPRGPVMPDGAVGADAKELEELLKDRGFDVEKVDVADAAPKDSVVGTIPEPGAPLSEGQTVVLVASKGDPPDEPSDYVVPEGILGSDAKDAEERLKDADLEVKKVHFDSTQPKDTVVATYPSPGSRVESGTVVLAVSTGP